MALSGRVPRRIATLLLFLCIAAAAFAGFRATRPPIPDDSDLTAIERIRSVMILRHLLAEAEAGDIEARYYLGRMAARGDGVPRSKVDAVRWLRPAAEKGHVGAQTELGRALLSENGGRSDAVEAAKWFRAAAEGGNADAQATLALMLSMGEGVDQDLESAYRWLLIAARTTTEEWLQRQALGRAQSVAAELAPEARSRAEESARQWTPKPR